jgi:UDP-3-O-[3-hydroxymyristoyl] glucosamine N-acyltransferase
MRSVQEIADSVQARVVGDGGVSLTGISSIVSAAKGDVVFVEEVRTLEDALRSRASAIIAGEFAAKASSSKPLLITVQPRLAFARAAAVLGKRSNRKAAIHPSAIVHPTAKLGSSVDLDEQVVIKENVSIAEHTWIGAHSVVGANTVIGEHCEIYPNVTIYPGVRLGNRVVVHSGAVLGSDGFGYVRDQTSGRYEKFPQVGRLEIEDDVEIGANSTIDRGALDVTRIRRGTKIDNLVHVGHNVQIGEDVVIAAQTGLSGSAVIENNVIMGGQVGIADHVHIEAGAILGAQSGIPSKKVIRGKGIVFWGTPARPIREYLKELAVLARLAKKQ